MKQIRAYIQPHKADDVKLALHEVAGLTGMSVNSTRGWGRGTSHKEAGPHLDLSGLEPHVEVEVFCVDRLVDEVVAAIEPNLPREGARSRVYNNVVRGNNTPNFAPEGNIVGTVPTGTGMLIMAFEDVEVFDNVIEDHMSAAIVVVHYDVSGFTTDDPDYNGAPKRIHIHDNRYSNNGYDVCYYTAHT